MGDFVSVGPTSDLSDGHMKAYVVDGTKIGIAQVGESLHAFGNVCTHQGCPLTKGKLNGTTVTCVCHGSEFDVTSGAVLEGPAKEPVPSYPAQVQGNDIQVRL